MTLKVHPTSKFGTIGAAAFAALAGAALAQPRIARADSSPSVTASSLAPVSASDTGAFRLTAVAPSAVVSSTEPRQLKICNKTGDTSILDEPSAMPPFMPSGSSTLTVSYNGKTEQIMPGECYRMNAQRVRITTDEPLGPRSDLKGTVMPARPGLFQVSNRTVGGNAVPVGAEIKEIRNDLKQDDRTVQQATAELKQATRNLNLAARELHGQPVA